MTRTRQNRKDEWKSERLQRVLDYHNKKYGTHIEIEGKTQNIRPNLKGSSDWDWVCFDTATGDEIAIEVKNLTDEKLEERANLLWQLLEKVTNSLSQSGELPGTFHLFVHIPNDYYLPFKQRNKQELRNLLYEVINRSAQKLKSGEKEDLEHEIFAGLSFQLDNRCSFTLAKLYNEGSIISKGSGTGGSWNSNSFNNSELEELERMVSQANIQLKKANAKETFLALIEEGYRWKNPPVVTEAFKNINPVSYSEITHVYFIRGKEVTEIPLPTP